MNGEELVQITAITEADLSALSRLYGLLFPTTTPLTRMKRIFVEINRNPGHLLLGAKAGNRLVGSAMGIICASLSGDCRPFMVIDNIVVSPESRDKGIGRALLQELELQAAARNCCYALLVSKIGREYTHVFLRSLGYNMDDYRGFKKHFK
jgi:ribosomal protein S18 acetylase RimI-like enzyme